MSRLVEKAFWWSFLILLVYPAFIQSVYGSLQWLLYTVVLYLFTGLYLLYVSIGGRINKLAIVAAKWPVFVLFSGVVWLGIQLYWPFDIHDPLGFISKLESLATSSEVVRSPIWFSPGLTWSLEPVQTQSQMMSALLCLTLFLLTLSLCDSRQRLKQMLIIILLVGLSHAISGVVAKYANLILVDPKQIDGHFSAARGWFVNRNHFAAMISLTMVAPLAFIIRRGMRSPVISLRDLQQHVMTISQLVFICCLVFGFFSLILSQSRAGLLGLPASIVLLSVIYRKKLNSHVGTYRTIFVFLITLVGITIFFGQDIMQRFTYGFLTIGERKTQWILTWQAIEQQWLLGYGGGSYATVFQIVREHAPLRQVTYAQSHNYYLHIWLEQGLIGLSLWLGFIVLVVKTAIRSLSHSRSSMTRSTTIACLIVIIAALLQSLVDFNLQKLNIRIYFFVIIAMIFCSYTLRNYRRRSTKSFTEKQS